MTPQIKFVAAFAVALLVGATSIQHAAYAQSADESVLTRDSVLRDPDVPVLGNPKGDITIVEYFDYQCPYCKKVDPELMQVAREDGSVRIVFKDWPIFGAPSIYAAKVALAAKFQGKYEEAHKALIGARTKLTETIIRDLLAKAGVDVSQATKDLQVNQKAIEAILARNNAQAEAFGFQGTPAFIVGTFRVPGVLDAAGFRRAIRDARATIK